jgi:hypothetical protein
LVVGRSSLASRQLERLTIGVCGLEIFVDYLLASEYLAYGLDATTPAALVAAASSMIDAHCRRTTLAVTQYEERIRMNPDRNAIRLTYLPLASVSPATSPIISAQGRYCIPRRGEWPFDDLRLNVALMFGLPGTWTAITAAGIDCDMTTGELTLPLNVMGLWFSEVDIVYTAGFAVIPDPAKFACAQIVRNAQATPALNVKAAHLDRMVMQYFSDTLVDQTVIAMLAPYVAQKLG